MTIEYWNVKHDWEVIDFEAASMDEAMKLAQEWWEEKCQDFDPPLRNGEEVSDIAWAVAFDRDGNQLQAHKFDLYYEHYHGDYAEHNTMHKGYGGSL